MATSHYAARAPGQLFDGAYIRNVASPYTPWQIRRYLRHIGWSSTDLGDDALQSNATEQPDSSVSFDASLENLSTLMFLHTITFPVENSDMHYTPEHNMAVDPQGIFTRMVLGSKGNYCFGHNGLLLGILRGLGYRVYAVSARVLISQRAAPPAYTFPSHLLLLVQPHPRSTVTYVVDVGFGGTGPIRPILLADGHGERRQHVDIDAGSIEGGWVWGTFPPERHRVVKAAYPASSLLADMSGSSAPQRDWHLQVAHSPVAMKPDVHDTAGHAIWTTLYTFSEAEFFQRDIEVASYAVNTLPGTIWSESVVAIRRFEIAREQARGLLQTSTGSEASVLNVLDSEGPSVRWMGKWSLEDRKAVKRLGAAKLEEVELRSELERVRLLKDVFGIGVSDADVKWIRGRKVALQTEDEAL